MNRIIAYIMMFCAVCFLGYSPMQYEFVKIIIGFTIAFLAYAYIHYHSFKFGFRELFLLGLICRIVLVFAFPNLSDDIYRFIWDGELIKSGINPYRYLPSEIQADGQYLKDLFINLNSPEYYSIYPPFTQIIFSIAVLGKDVFISSLILKSIFLVFELISYYLLIRILERGSKPKENVFYYWLNPLIIIELIGNIHFEAIMICFLLAAFYWFDLKKFFISALSLTLAIATKLLPLMLLPLLIRQLWKKSGFYIFWGTLIVATLVLFTPVFYFQDPSTFSESINLYFQKFEFNASVYFLIREIGIWITDYNQISFIGPFLSIISLSLICFWSLRSKEGIDAMLFVGLISFLIFLLNTTTVHPWYLATLIMFNCFFKYNFVVAWSFLIVLSYSCYYQQEFDQNLLTVFIEYFIVLVVFILFDLKSLKLDYKNSIKTSSRLG